MKSFYWKIKTSSFLICIFFCFKLYLTCFRFNKLFDTHTSPYFAYHSTVRWLAVRLDAITVAITTFTAFFIVFSTVYPEYLGERSSAFGGLALTYSIMVRYWFQFLANSFGFWKALTYLYFRWRGYSRSQFDLVYKQKRYLRRWNGWMNISPAVRRKKNRMQRT